jgi:hypothetical protein
VGLLKLWPELQVPKPQAITPSLTLDDMSSQPKLRVAIWYTASLNALLVWQLTSALSGGGVGGLTLACALSQYQDIQVDLYEAASRFTETGAGIGLWWRPRRVLSAMGLEKDVASLGVKFQDDRSESSSRAIYSFHANFGQLHA